MMGDNFYPLSFPINQRIPKITKIQVAPGPKHPELPVSPPLELVLLKA